MPEAMPDDLTPRLEEVAEGVFAYVQPDGGWCLNNAGIIVSEGETIVVDTAATVRRALDLARAVRRVGDAVPRAVVNTHSHGDHTFGNCVFADKSPIIAHAGVPGEMTVASLHLTTLWPKVEWGEIELALPSMLHHGRMDLSVGGIPVELHHLGPAHTRFDTVVWLPEQRVLYAGDIVMSGATPFCVMGSVAGMLEAVQRLRAFDARVIVPGHGPIAGPEALDVTEEYMRQLQKIAGEGVATGRTPLESAREADLGAFAGLLDSERLVANLHRAFAEARGAAPGDDLDVIAAFGELVEYHGGPPTCRA
jgi:cyclase